MARMCLRQTVNEQAMKSKGPPPLIPSVIPSRVEGPAVARNSCSGIEARVSGTRTVLD